MSLFLALSKDVTRFKLFGLSTLSGNVEPLLMSSSRSKRADSDF